MTPQELHLGTITPALDRARRILYRLTADAEPVVALAAAEALATLNDVTPAYPPIRDDAPFEAGPEPGAGGERGVASGIDGALTALRDAIDVATSIQELTRISMAAIALRQVSARGAS